MQLLAVDNLYVERDSRYTCLPISSDYPERLLTPKQTFLYRDPDFHYPVQIETSASSFKQGITQTVRDGRSSV